MLDMAHGNTPLPDRLWSVMQQSTLNRAALISGKDVSSYSSEEFGPGFTRIEMAGKGQVGDDRLARAIRSESVFAHPKALIESVYSEVYPEVAP